VASSVLCIALAPTEFPLENSLETPSLIHRQQRIAEDMLFRSVVAAGDVRCAGYARGTLAALCLAAGIVPAALGTAVAG
jgi:hypothetical protein